MYDLVMNPPRISRAADEISMKPSPAQTRLRCSRILLVDDVAGARARLRAIFNVLDAAIADAADGGEAFALICAQPFDLIVTDLCMEPVDGAKLIMATQLIAPVSRPRIMVHSADADAPSDAQKQALRFADGVVVKPATPARLLACAADLLGR